MIAPADRGKGRLDQWLWFARLTKTRSLAGRLCTAGAVTINGAVVAKANQSVRVGDLMLVPQGGFQRTVRVLALGVRRGPAVEARLLYDEVAEPVALSAGNAGWELLLAEDEPGP